NNVSSVGGRRSSRTATKAITSASASVKLCSASPISESELAYQPRTSSRTTNSDVAAVAAISLRETARGAWGCWCATGPSPRRLLHLLRLLYDRGLHRLAMRAQPPGQRRVGRGD